MVNKTIMAQTIRRLMDSKKMTTADLSRALGVSYTTVNDWVHGETYPRDAKLKILADLFMVDPDYLRIGKIRYHNQTTYYVSKHLDGIPQIEPYVRLLDAYQDADPKTRRAVNALLDLPEF